MRILYHQWLSPFCRKIRLILAEKDLAFELKEERVWDRRSDFLAMNPACQVPVLVDDEAPNETAVLADSTVIAEYLEEVYPQRLLIMGSPVERAEIRRLSAWFDGKFDEEVTRNLVGEKLMKRLLGLGGPSSEAIRAGLSNIHYHLDYIGYLCERRTWLGGDHLSLADLAAAAHLSCIDYIGNVPWDEHGDAKEWYARVKSRPSFRPLLADRMAGSAPPAHYADLDF
ncbi:glutathione S-transferase family protein [Oceanibaculum pacificum]|uniref:Glutathione S-transferase n=1 Tax=Oceanibaculum pacificum TaxID=580166 RepID=A0A154WFT0_9PROT|nr:glutathione S-transferase family protein [Oceanibaculum pacificum]KZD12315.1 glutathione S-transferase [Oceanibaculum pacificum]